MFLRDACPVPVQFKAKSKITLIVGRGPFAVDSSPPFGGGPSSPLRRGKVRITMIGIIESAIMTIIFEAITIDAASGPDRMKP